MRLTRAVLLALQHDPAELRKLAPEVADVLTVVWAQASKPGRKSPQRKLAVA